MFEKLIYIALTGAFGLGVWVTGIQFTLVSHGEDIRENTAHIREETKTNNEREKKYIDTVSRVDERLKNIETLIKRSAR